MNNRSNKRAGHWLGAAGLLCLLAMPVTVPASPMGGRANRMAQGYLGINFRDVGDEQVAVLKLKEARGVEVTQVDHDGPAFRSGLREHDVIVEMNGQAIEGEDQLRHMLREIPAGRTVAFVLSRDGQQQTLSAQLANRDTVGQEAWDRHIKVPEPSYGGHSFLGGTAPSAFDLPPKHGFLGSTVLSSSYTGALLELMGPQLEEFFGAVGLLVREVDPDSPAAVAGMHAGDIVVKINAMPVVSSADWLKTVHDNRGRALAVVVLRKGTEQILTLTPDAKKRSSLVPRLWPGARPVCDPVGDSALALALRRGLME